MSKTTIPITFKQTNPWGCGLYSVAHAMGIESYVTAERELISKGGNSIPLLTKWLFDDGLNYGIDVFFYDHMSKGKLPKDTLSIRSDNEDFVFPVLIQIEYSEKSLSHLIGGRVDHENNIYLYDSYSDYVEVIPLTELNDKYHNVTGMFAFTYLESGHEWVLIKS